MTNASASVITFLLCLTATPLVVRFPWQQFVSDIYSSIPATWFRQHVSLNLLSSKYSSYIKRRYVSNQWNISKVHLLIVFGDKNRHWMITVMNTIFKSNINQIRWLLCKMAQWNLRRLNPDLFVWTTYCTCSRLASSTRHFGVCTLKMKCFMFLCTDRISCPMSLIGWDLWLMEKHIFSTDMCRSTLVFPFIFAICFKTSAIILLQNFHNVLVTTCLNSRFTVYQKWTLINVLFLWE